MKTSDPSFKLLKGGRRVRLLQDLVIDYELGHYTVPKGFVSDLASVPRILWSIIPPWGKYYKAAIVHDYLYIQGKGGKAGKLRADNLFLSVMRHSEVGYIKRNIMYRAVRMFGRGNF